MYSRGYASLGSTVSKELRIIYTLWNKTGCVLSEEKSGKPIVHGFPVEHTKFTSVKFKLL